MNYEQARAKADIAGLKERARAHREKGMELLTENGDSRWKGLEQLGHATKTERWIEMLENESDPMWRCIERQGKQDKPQENERQSLTSIRVRQYVMDGEKCKSDRYMNIRPHKGAIEYGASASMRRVSDRPLTFR